MKRTLTGVLGLMLCGFAACDVEDSYDANVGSEEQELSHFKASWSCEPENGGDPITGSCVDWECVGVIRRAIRNGGLKGVFNCDINTGWSDLRVCAPVSSGMTDVQILDALENSCGAIADPAPEYDTSVPTKQI